MIDCTGKDLSEDPTARRVRKRRVQVSVTFATSSGVLQTLEGAVLYRPRDALLDGGAGERWPVMREKFEAAYEPVAPTQRGSDGTYVKRSLLVWAKLMGQPFSVRVGYASDPLQGKAGDWLLQYAPGDHGIVARDVFEKTYELRDHQERCGRE